MANSDTANPTGSVLSWRDVGSFFAGAGDTLAFGYGPEVKGWIVGKTSGMSQAEQAAYTEQARADLEQRHSEGWAACAGGAATFLVPQGLGLRLSGWGIKGIALGTKAIGLAKIGGAVEKASSVVSRTGGAFLLPFSSVLVSGKIAWEGLKGVFNPIRFLKKYTLPGIAAATAVVLPYMAAEEVKNTPAGETPSMWLRAGGALWDAESWLGRLFTHQLKSATHDLSQIDPAKVVQATGVAASAAGNVVGEAATSVLTPSSALAATVPGEASHDEVLAKAKGGEALFAFNKAEIPDDVKAALKKCAGELLDRVATGNTNSLTIEIGGFVDRVGSATSQRNVELAKLRAEAMATIVTEVIKEKGLEGRVEIKAGGKGQAEEAATNADNKLLRKATLQVKSVT